MPHRILLADDHEGIRRRVRSALENAGFDVCGEAANGQEAVSQAKGLMPDLIVPESFDARYEWSRSPSSDRPIPFLTQKCSFLRWTRETNYDEKLFAGGRTASLVRICSPLSDLVAGIEKLLR